MLRSATAGQHLGESPNPVLNRPSSFNVSAVPAVEDSLIPISLATLPVGESTEVNVYLRPDLTKPPILFCSAGQSVTLQNLKVVQESNNGKLYIHVNDRDAYQQSLRKNFESLIHEERLPVVERMGLLNDMIRDVLCEEFASGDVDSIVETCQSFGEHSASLIDQDHVLLRNLYQVLHHDYGTFTHSANVSAYCVMLAKELGYAADDLKKIASGGLLHDLGKLEISERILNKPGKLDDRERAVIESHPTLGFVRVADREDLSEGEFMMIYQHHERLNGRGYPVGIGGDEIHPWAKICAVVDVFEALTSNRPYRLKLSNATALAIIEKGISTEFDEELVKCWRRLVKE